MILFIQVLFMIASIFNLIVTCRAIYLEGLSGKVYSRPEVIVSQWILCFLALVSLTLSYSS